MRRVLCTAAFVAGFALPTLAAAASDSPGVERGRYLAKIGGCNDCHTPGYIMKNGQVPEQQWLTGDTLGWRGAMWLPRGPRSACS